MIEPIMVRIVADFHVLPRQAGGTKAGLAGQEEWWARTLSRCRFLRTSEVWSVDCFAVLLYVFTLPRWGGGGVIHY